MEVLLIALVVAAGIGVYILRERAVSRPRRRREAALRAVAARLGFSYERDRDPFGHQPQLDQRLRGGVPELEKAFYGYPHMLRGDSSVGPVAIFDVSSGGPGKGDATNPYKLTLAAFQLDAELPQFSIRSEGVTHQVGEAIFGFVTDRIEPSSRDHDFAEHAAFSDRYALRSADEEGVRALFGPELVTFWEALDPEERWAAAGAGKSLAVYREPKWSAGREGAVPPEEIPEFLRGAERIAGEIRSRALALRE